MPLRRSILLLILDHPLVTRYFRFRGITRRSSVNLKSLTKFIGKNLCRRIFYNKVAGLASKLNVNLKSH